MYEALSYELKRVRALVQRQRSEHALELEAIPAAAARTRPSAEGQDADTRAAQQEDLFAALMQVRDAPYADVCGRMLTYAAYADVCGRI